jgi:hypothetical protein
MELTINEMSEYFIVHLETDSDNGSSDTESTSKTHMNGVDRLDSLVWTAIGLPYMVERLSKSNILY